MTAVHWRQTGQIKRRKGLYRRLWRGDHRGGLLWKWVPPLHLSMSENSSHSSYNNIRHFKFLSLFTHFLTLEYKMRDLEEGSCCSFPYKWNGSDQLSSTKRKKNSIKDTQVWNEMRMSKCWQNFLNYLN